MPNFSQAHTQINNEAAKTIRDEIKYYKTEKSCLPIIKKQNKNKIEKIEKTKKNEQSNIKKEVIRNGKKNFFQRFGNKGNLKNI